MKKVIFVSYAWTSTAHREWVRLLASHLHLIGYSVLIDKNVDYGESLSGFMQKISEAAHVLLIVDENYVLRADTLPESGVGIESGWIKSIYHEKQANWLSVIFVHNTEHRLPAWLNEIKPKGFNFNSRPENGEFPGSIQINDIWRWLEDLPADTDNEVSVEELRARAARIERINRLGDPGNYSNPSISDTITFRHDEHHYYTVGIQEYEFKIMFNGCSYNKVYVLKDHLHSVGLITTPAYDRENLATFLTQGRSVAPTIRQSVVLMNKNGILCLVTILEVQQEINSSEFIPGHVTFTYDIIQFKQVK